MEAILSRLLADTPQTRRILKLLFIGLVLLGLATALAPLHGIDLSNGKDKIVHALVFMGFAFMLDIVTQRSFWRWKLPLLLLYGASIEILQALTPWRSFSVADFTADAIGVLLYWLLWKWVLQRFITHPNG